jgi:hypothetical protein
MTMDDWDPVSLRFDVIETAGAPDDSHAMSITSVVLDKHGVRVSYEVVPPLTDAVFGPTGVAEDDLGNRYQDCGGAFGNPPTGSSTNGVLTLPLPPSKATRLAVRLSWQDTESLWETPAHEVRITLG